jgi:predicted ribosome quality control (RQC) complex YloA/Tae2 family protein
MALGYFFLEKFVRKIHPLLEGSKFRSLLTHRKNALVIEFSDSNGKEQYLTLDLSPGREIYNLTNSFSYPKKNTTHLFQDLNGVGVLGIEIVKHERVFFIKTEIKNLLLVFKIFGNRSNVILIKNTKVIELFKNRNKDDLNFNLKDLQPLSTDIERAIKNPNELNKSFPFIDKATGRYLFEKGYYDLGIELQRDFLKKLEVQLEKRSAFYISPEDPPELSFFPFPGWEKLSPDILSGIGEYEKRSWNYFHLNLPIENAEKELKRKIKKLDSAISRLKKEYKEKSEIDPYSRKADLLMANLHLFQKGVYEAEVKDFYSGEKKSLKIKEKLSPQAQAGKWYNKSKNRARELKMDLERINNYKSQKDRLEVLHSEVKAAKNPRELEKILGRIPKSNPNKTEEGIPFRKIIFEDYEIRVGKSGEKNDQLLNKWSKKDDLWFHVRDASGSHVIVVNPSKKPLPLKVVEKAAELAVRFSKRKNERNCPVMVTERKYVRKKKGTPPGLVIVEKEKTVFT